MTDRTDWRVVQLPPVREAIGIAAASVVRDFGHVAELDDLKQDAAIVIATHPDKVLAYLADEEHPNYLIRWIWSRLRDQYRPHVRKTNQTVSLTRLEAIQL
ncbi:hypothetical protein [Umezawaea sp. Da 62-37]|uniref:hypothetical protein n=1 Tax=Umezawaea sp. Da 62-37 TaxID=3075927 RepID=UPI0028F6E0CC|nr:hypothetical protein [Umezawaea sp. Da 62-37]WNV90341.1 hypothetical protein RM788_19285 [Umezawaea sp. Da 62-37]